MSKQTLHDALILDSVIPLFHTL